MPGSVLLASLLLLSAPPEAQVVHRHVLIVANNVDPTGELAPLRYADDDGARFAELFSSAGARVELLTTLDAESQQLYPHLVGQSRPPNRERLNAALAHLFENIRQDRADGQPTELYFVFTGHGRVRDDGIGELLLADGPFTRDELLSGVIDASPADFNHVIIDACHAYFMVMGRGGWKDDRGGPGAVTALRSYLADGEVFHGRRATTGVILSTAGTAEVHEWERFRAGVFSHELRSALLGPADVDGDGRVSYAEIEAFVAAANAGVTNPKARIQLFTRPPAQDLGHPLLQIDSGGFTHVLRIPAGTAGHFQVEDSRGLAYAEWNKAPDHPAYLALLYPPVREAPRYFVRRDEQELQVELPAPGLGRTDIPFAEDQTRPAGVASRGSVAEAFRRELFSVPFGRAFLQGFSLHRDAAEEPPAEARAEAPPPMEPRRHHLALGYEIAGPVLPSDLPVHGLRLEYRYAFLDYLHLVAGVGWSRTTGSDDTSTEGIVALLGLGGEYRPLPWLSLLVDLTAGNAFLGSLTGPSHSGTGREEWMWDMSGPVISARGGLRFDLLDWLHLQLVAGAWVQFSVAGAGSSAQVAPEGLISLGFSL